MRLCCRTFPNLCIGRVKAGHSRIVQDDVLEIGIEPTIWTKKRAAIADSSSYKVILSLRLAKSQLVAASAIVAVVTAITAIATSVATIATAVVTAVAVAVTAIAMSEAATTALRTILARASDVYVNGLTLELCFVQSVDSLLAVFIAWHFNEAEAA